MSLPFFSYGPALAVIGWFLFNVHDTLNKNVMIAHNFVVVIGIVQIFVTIFAFATLLGRGQIMQLWRCNRLLVLS